MWGELRRLAVEELKKIDGWEYTKDDLLYDLVIFLETKPNVNDLQFWLYQQQQNWILASKLSDTEQAHKDLSIKIACVYQVLIDFTNSK